jgi:4-hydroxymandelate oxidase
MDTPHGTPPFPSCGRRPINLAEYEGLARRATEPAVWDYFAGGAEDETTLRENAVAFTRFTLRPRVLAGVRNVDLSVKVLNTELASPILVAPIGLQRLACEEGELATARAAASAGTLMVASTMASQSLEAIAQAGGPRWFQLYVMKDRGLTRSLVERASAAGYRAIVMTVDAPRLGRRERDLRNAFSLSGRHVPANLIAADAEPLLIRHDGASAIAAHALTAFDDALDWQTVAWVASLCQLPIVLKGVLTVEDARRAADAGVAGIVVSNHGGRQLDSVSAAIDVLVEIADLVGSRCEVYVDGGIRRGTDVLKCRALGARAVFVGRPILWGLLVDGEPGVRHVLDLLRAELETAMLLAGQSTWMGVTRALISKRT